MATVLAAGVVAVVTLGGWWLLDAGAELGEAPGIRIDPACEAPAAAWIGPGNRLWEFTEVALLVNNSSVRTCLPSPGGLALRLRGGAVAGIGAQVVIALGATSLWEGFVIDPIELELDVPHAGTMLIAFVNDRYEPPEDRNLWISDVVFTPH